jgi:hypothetical protein
MRKENRKISQGELMMLLAGVCLCLVLISLHITSGLYARYTTSASGSDSAGVIQFNQLTVTENGSFTESGSGENTFVFAPGVPMEKDIKISFGGSEASTIVFVAINAPNWKVTGDTKTVFTDAQGCLSWRVAEGWTFLESDQDLHIYYKELKPNETLSEVRFIDGGTIQVGASDTMDTMKIYESYPPTKFSVRGYAVQANEFETVAAAWDSVKE